MTSLVIFLHGVGSNGADLAPLGEAWRDRLPNTIFAAPDAPFACDQGGAGRQWFSIAGVTEANRPARVFEARGRFDRTIPEIVGAHGFANSPERVALVGFSQGTIMALDVLASGRWPVAAVVGFAGRLASPEPLAPSLATKALLIHGAADPVIPATESQRAAERLRQEGISIDTLFVPGVGHTISAGGAKAACDFLKKVFAG
ncbi:dienelactone hydrolase family protein [Mesorhizobium sp. VNQ89]|uniref:alpha/beta hydrolase n=1 Tax=Mesorhizobium quangtriensis TaxID=3157709 RepID=UPI0032B816EC